MQRINKILAVLNPAGEHQVALEKAARISRRLGGDIVALVCAHQASPTLLRSLERRLGELAVEGVRAALEVSQEKDPLRAILCSQHRSDCSLTVKEPHPTRLGDSLFTPLDWKLLRTNVSPILMTRGLYGTEGKPVIAAIEAHPADGEHQRLSARILEEASLIARLLEAPLHIVSAYPAPMQDAARRDQVPDLLEQEYRQACADLAQPFCIDANRIHVAPGPAELLLPEMADRLEAQLLVLGTVARSGLQGALLGNTAEQVLEKLSTDVLVLSPPPADGRD